MAKETMGTKFNSVTFLITKEINLIFRVLFEARVYVELGRGGENLYLLPSTFHLYHNFFEKMFENNSFWP